MQETERSRPKYTDTHTRVTGSLAPVRGKTESSTKLEHLGDGVLGGQKIVRGDVARLLDESLLVEQGAVEPNVGGPLAGGLAESENVEEGRLAGSRRSHDGERLAGLEEKTSPEKSEKCVENPRNHRLTLQ